MMWSWSWSCSGWCGSNCGNGCGRCSVISSGGVLVVDFGQWYCYMGFVY